MPFNGPKHHLRLYLRSNMTIFKSWNLQKEFWLKNNLTFEHLVDHDTLIFIADFFMTQISYTIVFKVKPKIVRNQISFYNDWKIWLCQYQNIKSFYISQKSFDKIQINSWRNIYVSLQYSLITLTNSPKICAASQERYYRTSYWFLEQQKDVPSKVFR